jgi:hypothetical protein
VRLRNISTTTDPTCPCGSWLAHWRNFSGQSVEYCPADNCYNNDLVGAHVQRGDASADQKWYIYPLCVTHSRHKGELDVLGAYKLVSANESETCGKHGAVTLPQTAGEPLSDRRSPVCHLNPWRRP